MFRRSHSNSNNFAVAAASAANAAAMAATVPRVQITRCGREVARFELPLAPRHVIPPQHKKDILSKAFCFQSNGMYITFNCRNLEILFVSLSKFPCMYKAATANIIR